MKIKTFSAIVIVATLMIGGAQTAEAATITVNCYKSCSPSYTYTENTYILELKCNSSSPTSYSGSLSVNGKSLSYSKSCPPPPSCTGSIPSDAIICSGDTSGLSSDTSWQAVPSCTTGRKCEYTRPVPSLTLTANPNQIIDGENTTISWTPVDADSCTASGDWSGSKSASSDSEVVTPSSAGTYTYSMECTNTYGNSSGIKSATVRVYNPMSVNINVSSDHQVGDTIVWLADVTGGIPYSGGNYEIRWTDDINKTGWYNNLSDRRIEDKYGVTGPVTVDLEAEDSKGNIDSDSKTITIKDTRLPQ